MSDGDFFSIDSVIEHDPEIRVWSMDEDGALNFFGYDKADVEIRVIKDKPETEREREKYDPRAKLFGIKHKLKEK